MSGEPFDTRCSRCGQELVCRVLWKKPRFFVREPSGSQRQVKICPGCGRELAGLSVEAVQEQTHRVP